MRNNIMLTHNNCYQFIVSLCVFVVDNNRNKENMSSAESATNSVYLYYTGVAAETNKHSRWMPQEDTRKCVFLCVCVLCGHLGEMSLKWDKEEVIYGVYGVYVHVTEIV